MSSKSKSDVHLDRHILPQFGMAKVFKYNNCSVNGLDLDATGRWLVTTSTDHCVRLYDCLEPKRRKVIECKKYSASCVQFSHHSKSVLLATHNGTNQNEMNSNHNVIRYLSLHDNAYIGSFYGHTDRITEISVSYLDDTFMSASIDRHIRLWDIRQNGSMAICKVPGRPTMAQDREGLIFAIGTGKNELKLYDRRKYEHGPFETMNGFPACNYEWCKMEFSPDGKYILISTRTNLLMLVDSFKGTVITQFVSYKNNTNDDIVASFTPNGEFIACGSSNGDIHFWSKDNEKVAVWKGHPRCIKYFKWNPKHLTAVSASQHLSLWLPRNANSMMHSNSNNHNGYPKKSSIRNHHRNSNDKS
eukprot:63311_1